MKPVRTGLTALAMGVALTACASRPSGPIATYGSPPALQSEAIPLDRALSEANLGRTLAVTGRVAEVCRMKGCWMVLTDDTRSVR